MAVNQTIHYELSTSADLDRLVADLPNVDADTIIVAFNFAREREPSDFQLARLVAASRTCNKRLIAENSRGRLAERGLMLGFHDSAVLSDAPSPNLADTNVMFAQNEEETTSIETSNDDAEVADIGDNGSASGSTEVDERFNSTADLATYRPSTTSTSRPIVSDSIDERVRSGTGVVKVASTIPAPSPPLESFNTASGPAPAQNQPGPSFTPVAAGRRPARISAPLVSEPDHHSRAHRRKRRMMIIAAAILAPVMVIVVVGAMAVYMLPTADVTIVPREETVTSTLTYGIAATNSSFDISIDPSPLSTISTAEATREATGERFEPAGTAGGTIQITNPLTQEVTVPAGTEIPGPNGVTYYTAEDAYITAADPYGSMSFGSGSVAVYAGIIGPDGNLDAGVLTGQLGSQMFYTNPGAISGGRMDRFTVIADEDVENVRQQVESSLLEKAEQEFEAEIPSGFEIVPGSLEIGDPEIEVSDSAGTDGVEVSASGTITVRAKIFDPEELHELAGEEADLQLRRHGGSERILLAETVSLNEPRALDGDVPAFEINVEAIARTVITEAEKRAIVDDITGLSRDEAEQSLSRHAKIERFEITVEPSWLLDRMPEISSRINIYVSSGEPTASR